MGNSPHNIRRRRERLELSQATVAWRVNQRMAQARISRAEYGKDPALVTEIRKVLVQAERSMRDWRRAERRIAAQRALFVGIPASAEKTAFEQMMVDRAHDLLDRGEFEGADALLEFLPAEIADEITRLHFGEQ